MHASIKAGWAGKEIDILEASRDEWIKKADGEVRVCIEGIELRVQRLIVEIVQK
jgi:hypothetical protein